jgi:hypothetical protein
MNKRNLSILLIVAAVLRLGFIWVAPFWYDEQFPLVLSRLPFSQMWAAMLGDVHPPLYYLLIWPLGQLLNITNLPVWILRLPSAIFSILAVWVWWMILQKLEPSPRVRNAALLLMVIMPAGLYYAQEARMYALLEFLVLHAFYMMWQRRWNLLTLDCVLLVFTQNYGIFYVAALCTIALIRDYQDWYEVLLTGLRTAAGYLFWVPFLLAQMHNIHAAYWMHLDDGGTVLSTIFKLVFMPDNNSVLEIPLMLAGFGWLVAAVLYTIFNRHVRNGEHTKYVAAILVMGFLPILLATIASLIWQPIIHYRPLIGCAPFLYLLMARPIEALYQDGKLKRIPALYAACWILPLLLVVDGMMYVYAAPNKSFNQVDADLKYIQAHWQPGDVVFNNGDDPFIGLYSISPDLPQYRISECSAGIGGLSDATRSALGVKMVTPDLDYKRAWIIWEYTPLSRVDRNCVADLFSLDLEKPVYGRISNEYIDIGLYLLEGKQ